MSRGTYIECDVCGKLDKNYYMDRGYDLVRGWSRLEVPVFEEFKLYHRQYEVCSLSCARKVLEKSQAYSITYERHKKRQMSKNEIIRFLDENYETWFDGLEDALSFLNKVVRTYGWDEVEEVKRGVLDHRYKLLRLDDEDGILDVFVDLKSQGSQFQIECTSSKSNI